MATQSRPPGDRPMAHADVTYVAPPTSARRTIRTMCPMNCHPTLCGMLVDVEDGRLVGVRGDHDNPDSQGFLCVRGQASRGIMGTPKRLLTPMIRDRPTDYARRSAWWEGAVRH